MAWRDALVLVQPATVICWHREGFRRYWRRRSQPRPGRPRLAAVVRTLIRQMARANPVWFHELTDAAAITFEPGKNLSATRVRPGPRVHLIRHLRAE